MLTGPRNADDYREVTAGHKAFAGVMQPSFRCSRCNGYRPIKGRKERVKGYPRLGWVCAECIKMY